ncbi:LbtU family siderophore porin [Thalassospiraceae bacterium LMO-JJ14]|nr:LbtU family siderophore porin [Thalassospiraceae bacterium LMO-JJ14]
MKPLTRTFLGSALCVSVFTLVLASPASAQEPKLGDLIKLIEKQQQQINSLRSRLEATEGKAEQAAAKADEAAAKPSILDKVTLGGVAEVEMTNTEAYSGADTSDITLAKVEFFVDTQPHEYLATHVQMLYEDDGTETISLDEAFATLGNTEQFPLYLQAGKWAGPFGGFDTAMSTDPLTKNLGETKEASILLGAAKGGFALEGFIYNGDTQKTGESNRIDQFGSALSYGGENGGVAFNGGIAYLNNMADSDGLTTALGTNATAINSYVSGFEAHGDVTFSGMTLLGGYMTALKSFQSGEVAFNGQGAKPVAWNLEAAYTLPVMGKETTFAATAQGTKEALALGLPETRYGAAVTVAIVDHFSITGEYLHDEDYAVSDGGTGNSGHTATLKLAAEY